MRSEFAINLALYLPAILSAQITTHGLPTFGPALIDAAGNVYLTGIDGPVTPGAAQTQPGGGECPAIGFHGITVFAACSDAHVTRVDPAGNTIFGTYLGGPSNDAGSALAVDSAGSIFITGTTGGSFPTTANAAIPNSSSSTVFAVKLSADGSRILYSTYLPEMAARSSAISVDAQGNAYIAGSTTTNHAYIAKLSADGSAFLYMKMLAGTGQESSTAVSVDAAGNIIVAGRTNSPDFPVSARALQSRLAGAQNVFLTKLTNSGDVVFSTYLGGSGTDDATSVQTDSAGNIYVAGATASLDFPTTPGSFQSDARVPLWNLAPGGFIAKLAPGGDALLYSSYVPTADGTSIIQNGVVVLRVTPLGDAYLAGATGAGFPITVSAPQACFGGSSDVFVAHLDPRGALEDATYLGGPLDDTAQALAVAEEGSVLLVSHSAGPDSVSRIRFGSSRWTQPVCLSPELLNSAALRGHGRVAPGEFVTLIGFGIGPDQGVAYQPDAQGRAPTTLAGVRVLFDGRPAPLIYVQSRQVNALVPFELSGQATTTVTLEYNGIVFGPITAPVSFGEPGVFRLQPDVSAQAYAVNDDGTLNGPANPAKRGSIISLWGTGFGPTDPPCTTGGLNQPGPANLAAGLSAQLFDGRAVPTIYAGSAPTLLCGVVQLNVRVPDYAEPGTFLFAPESVLSSSNGFSAVRGGFVTIAVK